MDVCVLQLEVWGVYIGAKGRFHHLTRGGSVEVDGRAATMWPAGHVFWEYRLFDLGFPFVTSWRMYPPSLDRNRAKSWLAGRPTIEPFGARLRWVGPTWSVKAHGGTTLGP
jgi:hypothetical protein